jgi:16S rRNA (guanine966-N2)-methyltransferase
VRITGGSLRGRNLVAPPDDRVRPTSDRVRQAIFNVLLHNDFGIGFSVAGAKVIDLFAGTGALGIEAISHGAAFALFVDDNAESRALIRTNVEALALTGVTKIWRRDATDLGPMTPGAGGPFNLAFLDPPYRKGLAMAALRSLSDGRWLASQAIAVVEAATDETLSAPDGFDALDLRSYGETAVHIFASSA